MYTPLTYTEPRRDFSERPSPPASSRPSLLGPWSVIHWSNSVSMSSAGGLAKSTSYQDLMTTEKLSGAEGCFDALPKPCELEGQDNCRRLNAFMIWDLAFSSSVSPFIFMTKTIRHTVQILQLSSPSGRFKINFLFHLQEYIISMSMSSHIS